MSELKISEHRKMVVMTGNLSDFHLNNLRNWPYLIFDKQDLSSVDIDYDFTDAKKDAGMVESLDAGKVVYDFKFNKELEYVNDEIKKRLDELARWTKHLFWEDTKVVFMKNGVKWKV